MASTSSHADATVPSSVAAAQQLRKLSRRPLSPKPKSPDCHALIEQNVEHDSRKQRTSILASVCLHLTLMVALAAFWLPAHGRSSGEILFSTEDVMRDVDLEQLRLESPEYELEASDSLEKTTQDETSEMAVAEPDLASLYEKGSNLTPILTDIASLNVKSAASRESLSTSPRAKKNDRYTTSFFGIPAAGRRFVYVLDMSTSMRERSRYGFSRFQVAARELLRSVEALNDEQQFIVVLFCYRTLFFANGKSATPELMPANRRNKTRLMSWLTQVQLAAGTDPRLGVLTALQLKPDAIFLLSDGEFNGRRRDLHRLPGNPRIEIVIAGNRQGPTPIHTVAFDDEESRVRLAWIAQATGGQHRFVGN